MMVKIVVLLENTTESSNLKCKHGFSLYAETEKHKILFDMGPNDLFLRNAEMVSDDFCHEQNLIITSGNSRTLICGCMHAGIVNIIERAKTITGDNPTAVIGGMHLYEPTMRR